MLRGPGADYGLGTIGTCLGPPPDQKKMPMLTEKKGKENYKNRDSVG